MNTGNSHGDFLAAINGARPEPVSVLEVAGGEPKRKPKPFVQPWQELPIKQDVDPDPSAGHTVEELINDLDIQISNLSGMGELMDELSPQLHKDRHAVIRILKAQREREKKDPEAREFRLETRKERQAEFEAKKKKRNQ